MSTRPTRAGEPRRLGHQPVRPLGLRPLVLAAADLADGRPGRGALLHGGAARSPGTPNTTCPGIPNPSLVPESFLDTMLVNGTAYPTVDVEPKAYRFRILNAGQDRNLNLQPLRGRRHRHRGADGHAVPTSATTSTRRRAAAARADRPVRRPAHRRHADHGAAPCCPSSWPTDGRVGGVPDPAAGGPDIDPDRHRGRLPAAPSLHPPMPMGYDYNRRSIVVLNVLNNGLFIGPAERADVVVDFSAFAGQDPDPLQRRAGAGAGLRHAHRLLHR